MKNKQLNYAHQVIVLVVIASISAFLAAFINPGNVVKQDRQVPSFTSLDVSSAFHVYLNQGENESLTVEADEEFMDQIITEVQGSTLKIYWKKGKECRNSGDINIYLTFRELDHIEVSGAVDMEAEKKLKFDNIELEISGAAKIDLPMIADELELDVSGASQVKLSGACDESSMEISGASDVDAGELEAESMSLEVSGAAQVVVNVKEDLDVEVSGASYVKYYGKPEVKSEVSGAGKLVGKE